MSTRDDLRPGTTSPQSEDFAGRGWPTRSERDRAADIARACEALGIPAALPVPQQSPPMDEQAGHALLHAVVEYLREVFGTRTVPSPPMHVRQIADHAVSSRRDAA